jgi:hypothetical protein
VPSRFWKISALLFGIITMFLLVLNAIYFIVNATNYTDGFFYDLGPFMLLVVNVQMIGLGISTAVLTGVCLYQYNVVVQISEAARPSQHFSPEDEAMINVLLKDGDG